MQKHALETTFFVTLRRIFDKRKDANSIGKFLEQTVHNPQLFSREAFAARRVKAGTGQKSEGLDDYISEIWVPSTESLRKIDNTLTPYREKYGLYHLHETLRDLFHDGLSPGDSPARYHYRERIARNRERIARITQEALNDLRASA